MRNSFQIILIGVVLLLILGALQFFYTPKTLELGPVTTFDNSCASCHGPQGKFYGTGFANLEHDKLKHTIEEMMKGPAFLKPSEGEIEAMTAYHYALSNNEPFICITRIDSVNKKIFGETIPGVSLYLKNDNAANKKIQVKQSGEWQISFSQIDTIVARTDSSKIMLYPADQQWTHHVSEP